MHKVNFASLFFGYLNRNSHAHEHFTCTGTLPVPVHRYRGILRSLLCKDSLVNCFGKTSRISASSFSSSSVICFNIFCHGKDTIQFQHHLRSHSNKARLKSGKAKSTSQSSGFTDVFLSIFG